ncbi:hypothetical protein NM208_g13750 [Fusarium decemcellulare]|uniref:Uncharacterized protein n=1 Tax=Fusarium decemcellulare TaxID=57161 RepID=A0ACC1RMU0_9HYPO|nr:hypothetical protein NM208_g13750 [Fusarium decemcellulare]
MQQLQAREHGGDQLVAAALLLAYYEIQNGTPRGIRNHVSGLNALASKLDLTKPFGSELFRAWRILRYDLRFLRMPTRNSVLSLDSHDRYATFDSHLTIRDLLSQLWLMYGRFYTEITFTSGTQTCTAQTARQAARWIRSLLGRRCDFEQHDNDDFHRENLSTTSIVDQLQAISLQLDNWHSVLND